MFKRIKRRMVSLLAAAAFVVVPVGAVESCDPGNDDATPISIPAPVDATPISIPDYA
ncbi:MAG: hypothetical protein ACE5EX_12460 [Phycisphaerae bacterium]